MFALLPVRTTFLATPSLPLVVPRAVFDEFGWTPSRVLEWRSPDSPLVIGPLDADLPLGMAFVLRQSWPAIPTELARLHVGRRYELGDELALAPYGIDDATDQLFAERRDAHATFWLATDNLNALFWALHDWAHFHNHGPFVERTATELQCDVSALCWLRLNRERIPLGDHAWESWCEQVRAVHRARCEHEPPGVALDDSILLDAARLRTLAESLEPAMQR